jgi:hypothetical protein
MRADCTRQYKIVLDTPICLWALLNFDIEMKMTLLLLDPGSEFKEKNKTVITQQMQRQARLPCKFACMFSI